MPFFEKIFWLEDHDYVQLSDSAMKSLGMSFEKLKKYIWKESPDFVADGLRLSGNPLDSHLCMIHRDDFKELCERIARVGSLTHHGS